MNNFAIWNNKWEIVFHWKFETRKDCLEKYTWGNMIQWKWKPSNWWKIRKLKENESITEAKMIQWWKITIVPCLTTTWKWNPSEEEKENALVY